MQALDAYLRRSVTGGIGFKDISPILDALVDSLCSAIGYFTNVHQLAKDVGARLGTSISDHTIRNYLASLEDSGLFAPALRYDIKRRKYYASPLKYYAADVRLHNARLGFNPEGRPRLLENLIFNELIRRGYSVDIGVVVQNKRDRGGRQVQTHHIIDYIVNNGREKTYLQFVPDHDKPAQLERALCPLRDTGDFFRRFVILDDTQPLTIDDSGIGYIGVIPFLLNEEHSRI